MNDANILLSLLSLLLLLLPHNVRHHARACWDGSGSLSDPKRIGTETDVTDYDLTMDLRKRRVTAMTRVVILSCTMWLQSALSVRAAPYDPRYISDQNKSVLWKNPPQSSGYEKGNPKWYDLIETWAKQTGLGTVLFLVNIL